MQSYHGCSEQYLDQPSYGASQLQRTYSQHHQSTPQHSVMHWGETCPFTMSTHVEIIEHHLHLLHLLHETVEEL